LRGNLTLLENWTGALQHVRLYLTNMRLGGRQMTPTTFQKVSYVALLIVMIGVASGALQGL